MIARGGLLLTAWLTAGCAFPDYTFATRTDSATVAPEDTSAIDSSIADTESDSIFPTDDTAPGDSTVKDTTVVDTTPPKDTMVVDTGPPKTGCAVLSSMFCRDWDSSGATAFTGWMGNYIRGGGGLTVDTVIFRSGPRSLQALLPANDGSFEASANLDHTFTATSESKGMYLDFWARFDGIPGVSGPLVAKLSRGAGGRGLALYLGKGHFAVDAMGPAGTTNYEMTGVLPSNTWIHVRLEAVLSMTTSGSFKLFIDDMTTPNVSKSGIATTNSGGTDVKLNLGFYNSDPDSGRKAWFDDVQFDWM